MNICDLILMKSLSQVFQDRDNVYSVEIEFTKTARFDDTSLQLCSLQQWHRIFNSRKAQILKYTLKAISSNNMLIELCSHAEYT